MMKTVYMDEFRYKFYPRREIILPTNYFKTYLDELEDAGLSSKKEPKLQNTNIYEKMEKDDLDLTNYMIDYSVKKSRMSFYPKEIPPPRVMSEYYPVRYAKDTWSNRPRGICPKYFM